MSTQHAVLFATPVGWVCASWRDDLLIEMTFGHSSPEEAVKSLRLGTIDPTAPDRKTRRFCQRLDDFLRQPQDDFLDVALDLGDYTPFQRRVVEQCRTIEIGETCTYAKLSELAGHPGAARATGQVMATNRFPLIVPCHRVVGSGGSLGGYSAPNGLQLKQRLLNLESQVRTPRTKRSSSGATAGQASSRTQVTGINSVARD